MKSVTSGLRKILNFLDDDTSGVSIFTDGNTFRWEDYSGIEKIYYCGSSYQYNILEVSDPILLVVIDSQDAAIGTTDGNRINILWSESSMVMGKHKAGGQSAQRFARDRERALNEWLNLILDRVLYYLDKEKIMIGGQGMTKDKFIKKMHPTIKEKIISVSTVGYTDENGLFELMKISRY